MVALWSWTIHWSLENQAEDTPQVLSIPTYSTPNSYLIQQNNPFTPPESLGMIIAEPEPITEFQNTWDCQCVNFAKQFSEKLTDTIVPSPFYLWRNYKSYGLEIASGEIGDLIITSENRFLGHIGVVASLTETDIYILDKNRYPCQITNRTLPKNSDLIVGYLR